MNLGVLPGGQASLGWGVSGDGSVVTGYGGSSAGARAFRWTSAGGMVSIGNEEMHPNGISQDGSTIVGIVSIGNPRASRWSGGGGMQNLGTLPGHATSFAIASNSDGSIVVGQSSSGAIGSQRAFRWNSEIGMQAMANVSSTPNAINGDGTVVVGDSANGPFLWNPSLGMVNLKAYLSARCLNLTGWEFSTARGISADGRTFCGIGGHNGKSVIWLASLLKFSQQPAATSACASSVATFSAPGVGTNLTYQWQWRSPDFPDWVNATDGLNLNPSTGQPAFNALGSQTSTFTRSDCEGCDSDWSAPSSEFRCIVSNACESVTSNPASFVVCHADLSCDGQVDDSDFVPFAAAYNTLDCADPAMPLGCPSDINRDGFVDDSDFVIFAAAYNKLSCN